MSSFDPVETFVNTAAFPLLSSTIITSVRFGIMTAGLHVTPSVLRKILASCSSSLPVVKPQPTVNDLSPATTILGSLWGRSVDTVLFFQELPPFSLLYASRLTLFTKEVAI